MAFILSEKVERHLTGQDLGDEGVMSLVKDIPRTVGRELTKLLVFTSRYWFFVIVLFPAHYWASLVVLI